MYAYGMLTQATKFKPLQLGAFSPVVLPTQFRTSQ